eukprot:340418-Prorocentrum_minimum.AAC.2
MIGTFLTSAIVNPTPVTLKTAFESNYASDFRQYRINQPRYNVPTSLRTAIEVLVLHSQHQSDKLEVCSHRCSLT